ncbi:hypothetical protein G6F24_017859 [Rhizopus arrhizus]|nr:hypothetical protein G6F24_017859 [Rhizopus arrhizus]
MMKVPPSTSTRSFLVFCDSASMRAVSSGECFWGVLTVELWHAVSRSAVGTSDFRRTGRRGGMRITDQFWMD